MSSVSAAVLRWVVQMGRNRMQRPRRLPGPEPAANQVFGRASQILSPLLQMNLVAQGRGVHVPLWREKLRSIWIETVDDRKEG